MVVTRITFSNRNSNHTPLSFTCAMVVLLSASSRMISLVLLLLITTIVVSLMSTITNRNRNSNYSFIHLRNVGHVIRLVKNDELGHRDPI